MKKVLILGLVVIMALFMIGCSDDDDDNAVVTKAVFTNATNHEIEVTLPDYTFSFVLAAGESTSKTYNAESFTDFDEITDSYTVSGDYFDSSIERTYVIAQGEELDVTITADGGRVNIVNNFNASINSAYLYLASSSEFGNNVLTAFLAAGEEFDVLKAAGNYKLTVNLDNSETYTFDNIALTEDVTVLGVSTLGVKNTSGGLVTFKVDNNPSQTIGTSDDFTVTVIDDSYEDDVDLQLSGYFIFNKTEQFDFSYAAMHEYTVEAEGGVVKINNMSSNNITEVYISPSANTEWGQDWLTGTIAPGSNYAWTVEPGTYDIKIIDDQAFEAEIYEEVITIANTSNYDYSTDGKKQGVHNNLKNKSNFNFKKIEGRVEAN